MNARKFSTPCEDCPFCKGVPGFHLCPTCSGRVKKDLDRQNGLDLQSVIVVDRTAHTSSVVIQGTDNHKPFFVITVLSEGRDVPECLDYFSHEFIEDEQFIIALHNQLQEQYPDLVEVEFQRIMG